MVAAWWSLFVSSGSWVAETLFQEGEIIKPKRSIKMPGSYQVNWEEELLCGPRGQVNYSEVDCLGLLVRPLRQDTVLSCQKRVCLSPACNKESKSHSMLFLLLLYYPICESRDKVVPSHLIPDRQSQQVRGAGIHSGWVARSHNTHTRHSPPH